MAMPNPSPETAPISGGLVATAVVQRAGLPAEWTTPDGYRTSLALCVIDSIQSTGVRYGTVKHVVKRYRDHRGAAAETDGAPELLQVFTDLGVEGFTTTIGTRNKVSTRPGAKTKAEVIRDAADLLAGTAPTTADLREQASDPALKAGWLALPGQRSGITWRYLLMLAGVPGVKPDRMIRRYVARTLDRPAASFTSAELVDVVTEAAAELGVSATVLDHAIWRVESGRL